MENLGNTSARESSPDGAVTVVGANGALHNIELSPRIAEHSPAALAAGFTSVPSSPGRQAEHESFNGQLGGLNLDSQSGGSSHSHAEPMDES